MEERVRFVDTHAHLALLEHAPLDQILERAKQQGIFRMVTVSTDEGSWESNRNLASLYEQLTYTLGLHPHDAIRWAECAGKLNDLFAKAVPEKCVAIGEMGLDFHYDFSPRDTQIDVFEAQLNLANRVSLPVVIHCRDAFDDLFASIRKVGLSDRGGVMHCFTGTLAQALEAVSLGLRISFSGILTFKTAETLRMAAKGVPETSLLLETDCPYLAPIPFRGKPNEPCFLPRTAECLAAVRGDSVERIAELTTQNAIEFFRLEDSH